MINCKTLIIFTSVVFLSAESRPFGDLLRTLINGHLFHPHTRIVDHHHYYTDDIHRRNDHVHGPLYYHHQHHQHHEGYPHPPHGELLHRIHSSDNQPAVICCRVNPLQPYYKKPATSPSEHRVEGHVEHYGHVGGVTHGPGLHTSVIYHGHGSSGHESMPHLHHMVICDNKHHHNEHGDKHTGSQEDIHQENHGDKQHAGHDDKHQEGHDDKHQEGHDDKHHENHDDGHHDKHHEHHEDHSDEVHGNHHSDEHHDNKHHENQDKNHGDHHSGEHHEDHSDEQHKDQHHEDNTSTIIDESKINEKPSYEVFENVSDVPKESFSNLNVNGISKKSEDNIVL